MPPCPARLRCAGHWLSHCRHCPPAGRGSLCQTPGSCSIKCNTMKLSPAAQCASPGAVHYVGAMPVQRHGTTPTCHVLASSSRKARSCACTHSNFTCAHLARSSGHRGRSFSTHVLLHSSMDTLPPSTCTVTPSCSACMHGAHVRRASSSMP